MPSFSFDVVSDYDKAEINNVFQAVERELASRFDFKGTPAAIEWLEDKKGFRVIGAGPWQCETIVDIIRKKLISRNQSSKVLDLSKEPAESNMKATLEIPFRQGIEQETAKKITKLLRDEVPKVKSQIQGDEVRVTGSSKDELQKAIQLIQAADFDLPLLFINFR